MGHTILKPEVRHHATAAERSAVLSRNWLPEARLRLAGLAAFVGLANLGLLLFFLLGPISGDYDPSARTLNQTAFAFQGAASALIVFICLTGRLPDRLIPTVGLTYQFYICWLTSLTVARGTWVLYGHLPLVTWTTAIIVAFPLVVPSLPRVTLTAALLAAATRPLSIIYLDLEGLFDATLGDVTLAAASPTLAALAAYAGSRLVYRFERELESARELGSYRLEARIGAGGMGEVWRASHQMLARPAAVKVVRPELLLSADGDTADFYDTLDRFEREAQLIAQLRSPHTVELYDFGRTSDGALYYAMELLDGVDLASLLKRFGPVPHERVVHLLRQACHSHQEAHAVGIVHRDIKPANLVVCRHGVDHDVLKVLDFGLAELLVGSGAWTDRSGASDGPVVGTPGFMAPEIIQGAPADPRTDIYAVGCVAHWLLTGRLLFEGGNAMDLAMGHLNRAPPTVRDVGGAAIPDALQALILECLAKAPSERPASAQAVSARLAAVEGAEAWTPERAEAWWRQHDPATAVSDPGVLAAPLQPTAVAETRPAAYSDGEM